MNNVIVDAISSLQHQFAAHDGGEERLLPLDGRDWTRLVNMRIQMNRQIATRESIRHDFWTMLHSDESPLRRYRESNRRAIIHWFLRGEDNYEGSWKTMYKPTYSFSAPETFSRMGNIKEALEEFERVWQAPVEKYSTAKKDAYWDSDLNEFWESRTPSVPANRRVQMGASYSGN